MAETLHELIPGLREVEDRYRSESSEAFSGIEPKIARSIEILPLTPRMFLDLAGGECAFTCNIGREVDERDVAVLLWRCSPFYERGNDDLRRFYQASLAMVPYEAAVVDICEYVRRSLAGMPLWKGKIGGSRSVSAWPSRLVHMFAKDYGWGEDQVLDTPFRRLWQYANRILEERDPRYTEKCPEALELRAEFLRRLNANAPAGAN